MSKIAPGHSHYVNNKELTAALTEYAKKYRDANGDPVAEGRVRNGMSAYLANTVITMAVRLSLAANFRDYSFREDMIGQAIEATLKYMHNFNAEKYNNGFAYVTQIMFSAMVQVIKKEKKLEKNNMQLIQNLGTDLAGWAIDDSGEDTEAQNQAIHYAGQRLHDIAGSELEGEEKSKAGGSRKTTTRPKKRLKKSNV